MRTERSRLSLKQHSRPGLSRYYSLVPGISRWRLAFIIRLKLKQAFVSGCSSVDVLFCKLSADVLTGGGGGVGGGVYGYKR